MRTVYKYPLNDYRHDGLVATWAKIHVGAMPRGAQILRCDLQHGVPTLWALVDTEEPLRARRFRIAGTGHDLETATADLYVGTFFDGGLVFHIFEEPALAQLGFPDGTEEAT